MTRTNTRTCVAAAVLALLAGCGSSGSESTPTPLATSSATPSPEDEATAAYQRYWEVYVQMANSGDVDAGYYSGVAQGGLVENDLALLSAQADSGVTRVGEPVIGEYETSVSGTTATSVVCVDQSPWGAEADGEPIDRSGTEPNPQPQRATLEDRDGTWIVTDRTVDDEVTCP